VKSHARDRGLPLLEPFSRIQLAMIATDIGVNIYNQDIAPPAGSQIAAWLSSAIRLASLLIRTTLREGDGLFVLCSLPFAFRHVAD
jgi:hypothetical protein